MTKQLRNIIVAVDVAFMAVVVVFLGLNSLIVPAVALAVIGAVEVVVLMTVLDRQIAAREGTKGDSQPQ